MSASWYVIHTKPQQERTALINLERQGYVVYLPIHRQRRRRLNQQQWVTGPLFPRYLFIQLSMETDNWGPIRSTRGVANLVRFGGLPAKVPEDFVAYLKSQESIRLEEAPSPKAFAPGDSIEITTGLMTGYDGVFQEKLGSKRALILLNIADRHTVIQVPLDDLE